MGMIWFIAAAVWGAAEASFFFIVPDVLLTAAALRLGPCRALLLCLVSAVSAALTGCALWLWAGHDPATARNAVEAGSRHIPLLLFVPVSLAARLFRFVLTALLAAAAGHLLRRFNRPGLVTPLWVCVWCLVYLVYFSERGLI